MFFSKKREIFLEKNKYLSKDNYINKIAKSNKYKHVKKLCQNIQNLKKSSKKINISFRRNT